ncbi:uncharacterized protein RCO7_15091 [Rhynchosporium graminicola]|uniref:Uncharacterized protein n=1 Tax=Rhynchosporium graminicola TaxID=2792576 RepID=A0A1E1LJV3_9HELO|nr:uncharacterized protein RCO7_15091 [Rhynchosporium commune]
MRGSFGAVRYIIEEYEHLDDLRNECFSSLTHADAKTCPSDPKLIPMTVQFYVSVEATLAIRLLERNITHYWRGTIILL